MRSLAVGLVVILGLAIFMGAVLVVGQETHLFAAKMTYRTNFPDASGLRVGSPVTIAGVRVGTVARIVLPTNPDSEGIEVFLSVDRSYAARVRQGTEASLVILQFVANEKSVDLSPGDPDKNQLGDGAFIPPAVQQAILEQGRTIASTLELATSDLSEILGAIRRGEGLLGKAIVDPEFGTEGLESLQRALDASEALLARVNRGEGLMGRMVSDREFAEAVTADLKTATSGIAAVAQRIERGEGLLGRLSTGSEGEALAEDLRQLGRALRSVADGLEHGEGLAGVLLRDEALAERVSANLDETLARLASISRKIDEGEGTLGLLVNDRGLYDEAQTLVTGVRSSRLASWLIRRYHRRGEREREKAEKRRSREEVPEGAGLTGPEATYWPPFPGADSRGERAAVEAAEAMP
ncbi:MAG: MlaD family protein [Acidobacteriota bacterium]|nr:MlaD family protein [Acidobacteriota bacterium]